MSKITVATKFGAGDYTVVAHPNTGTVKLQMTADGAPITDIPGASFTSGTDIIEIGFPDCLITPVITGDAEIFVSPKRTIIRDTI